MKQISRGIIVIITMFIFNSCNYMSIEYQDVETFKNRGNIKITKTLDVEIQYIYNDEYNTSQWDEHFEYYYATIIIEDRENIKNIRNVDLNLMDYDTKKKITVERIDCTTDHIRLMKGVKVEDILNKNHDSSVLFYYLYSAEVLKHNKIELDLDVSYLENNSLKVFHVKKIIRKVEHKKSAPWLV